VLNACELYERVLPPQFKPLQLVGSRVPGSLWLVGQLLRFRPVQWAAGYTLEAAEKLKSFAKPVLLVWGNDDKLFPLEYPRRFAGALPNARLEVIADSRTFTPEDQPAAMAELISRFVREPAKPGRNGGRRQSPARRRTYVGRNET